MNRGGIYTYDGEDFYGDGREVSMDRDATLKVGETPLDTAQVIALLAALASIMCLVIAGIHYLSPWLFWPRRNDEPVHSGYGEAWILPAGCHPRPRTYL